jgi:hypothetical protein
MSKHFVLLNFYQYILKINQFIHLFNDAILINHCFFLFLKFIFLLHSNQFLLKILILNSIIIEKNYYNSIYCSNKFNIPF